MKCIYCDAEARYVMAGVSVCYEHTKNISTSDIPSYRGFKKTDLCKFMEGEE